MTKNTPMYSSIIFRKDRTTSYSALPLYALLTRVISMYLLCVWQLPGMKETEVILIPPQRVQGIMKEKHTHKHLKHIHPLLGLGTRVAA